MKPRSRPPIEAVDDSGGGRATTASGAAEFMGAFQGLFGGFHFLAERPDESLLSFELAPSSELARLMYTDPLPAIHAQRWLRTKVSHFSGALRSLW
jgi:hypothetical protein